MTRGIEPVTVERRRTEEELQGAVQRIALQKAFPFLLAGFTAMTVFVGGLGWKWMEGRERAAAELRTHFDRRMDEALALLRVSSALSATNALEIKHIKESREEILRRTNELVRDRGEIFREGIAKDAEQDARIRRLEMR